MKQVSVIVPTYQRANMIDKAINSALNQTYKDLEIIVVDDGSTDNTAEILKKYEGQIKYVYQENRGVSSARNTGISMSQGEFIAFLDSDDAWTSDKLEKQLPLFKRNQRVGLVCSDIQIIDENGATKGSLFKDVPPSSGMLYPVIFSRSFIANSSVVVRRCCFDEAGLFDETLSGPEDHDMWLRISSKWEIDYVNEPLTIYSDFGSNQLSKNSERMMIDYLSIQEKAFLAHPELHYLDQQVLDRSYFNYYLELAIFYYSKNQVEKARRELKRYAAVRGVTRAYLKIYLITFLPKFMIEKITSIRRFYAALKFELNKLGQTNRIHF